MCVWRRLIYLGCSVHCQQSAWTKSANGGQVYNNTTLSVCVCVCVEEGVVCVRRVWCVEGQGAVCICGGGEVETVALSHLSNIRGRSI